MELSLRATEIFKYFLSLSKSEPEIGYKNRCLESINAQNSISIYILAYEISGKRVSLRCFYQVIKVSQVLRVLSLDLK
jgi:hypothetical protein